MHVRKNMAIKLGATKATGIGFYNEAVHAPTTDAVDAIIAQYCPIQKSYFEKFKKAELYRAYSKLIDFTTTSQGAESQMSASLLNHIRSVEPRKMIMNVLFTQRSNFMKKQGLALNCENPVPPFMEQHLAKQIIRARVYFSFVTFISGADQMEATAQSFTDGSRRRVVKLSSQPNTPPSCCSYSKNGSGVPCLHGIAVLSEKHGSPNLHKFIDKRHLTSAWHEQYTDITFPLPSQHDVDNVMVLAKRAVVKGDNLQIPKAIPPPRGRPVKGTGKRRKG